MAVPRHDEPELLTIRETLSQIGVDDIKPLLALLGLSLLGRKAELVDRLATVLESPAQIRSLYDGLGDLAQKAVQEATHDARGVWYAQRFRAKYGGAPDFGGSGRYPSERKPTTLRLFFPRERCLPTDL